MQCKNTIHFSGIPETAAVQLQVILLGPLLYSLQRITGRFLVICLLFLCRLFVRTRIVTHGSGVLQIYRLYEAELPVWRNG